MATGIVKRNRARKTINQGKYTPLLVLFSSLQSSLLAQTVKLLSYVPEIAYIVGPGMNAPELSY